MEYIMKKLIVILSFLSIASLGAMQPKYRVVTVTEALALRGDSRMLKVLLASGVTGAIALAVKYGLGAKLKEALRSTTPEEKMKLFMEQCVSEDVQVSHVELAAVSNSEMSDAQGLAAADTGALIALRDAAEIVVEAAVADVTAEAESREEVVRGAVTEILAMATLEQKDEDTKSDSDLDLPDLEVITGPAQESVTVDAFVAPVDSPKKVQKVCSFKRRQPTFSQRVWDYAVKTTAVVIVASPWLKKLISE